MEEIITENIMGYRVVSSPLSHLLGVIQDWVVEGNYCKMLSCINPHSYVVSMDDHQFSSALNRSDWLIPDGTGFIIASYLLGGCINQRITGSDIFYGLHNKINQIGSRVFFLGSTETTLQCICQKMQIDWPSIKIAGMYSPPYRSYFSETDNRDMVAAINDNSPDILWVGMTAPKQEKWLFNNLNKLNVKFAGAVGAVFDFYTGRVKRSPPVFQNLGLEWFPRLIHEPKRLWNRNLVSTPKFLFRLAKEKMALRR